jgi:acetyl esterase/lipase
MKMKAAVVVALAALLVLPASVFGQGRIEKNVVVGMVSGLALVMDVHLPDEPNGYGIVHISGSAFSRPLAYNAPLISESQAGIYGEPLVAKGYTVFSLNHRATPRFRYPAPLLDVQRAVRFIRYHAQEYGIDPDRIGAVGGSSGGMLVSLLGVLDGKGDPDDPDAINGVSAKVQVVVARAAPVDHTRWSTGEVGALLFGASNSQDPQSEEARRYREASAINYVSADDPPFLLIHGDADQTIPFEQAGLMSDALKEVGVDSRVIRIPGAGHGPTFPGAENPPDYIGAMTDWFDQHLKE